MGQRANLILIEGGRLGLFYCHWCANTLTRDLFWGPEIAAGWIRLQSPVDETGWLDERWAEGGAVVDRDARVLLLYGGEDLAYELPMRRAYLAMLGRAWPGWDVRWAHEGIADLADYARHPRREVLVDEAEAPVVYPLEPPKEPGWTRIVASVRFDEGTLRFFPLAGKVPAYLRGGPRIFETLTGDQGRERLALGEWTATFPQGGFHADLARKELRFWTVPDAPGIVERLAHAWPGWSLSWDRDRYEGQIERAEGRLRFPEADPEALRAQVREMLLWEPGRGPVAGLVEFAEQQRGQGREVEVNPLAFRDDPMTLDRGRKLAILASIEAPPEGDPPSSPGDHRP